MIIIPTEKRFDWKHTPVMLFFIVLINTLVFFFYQSGDTEKFYTALDRYDQYQLLELEWPAFKTFLSSIGEEDELAEYQRQYQTDYHDDLIISLLMREDFYAYLKANGAKILAHTDNHTLTTQWAAIREDINATIQSISTIKFGLTPKYLKPLTLLSHQFLHGDTMHLFGNMFFLVICGFAVEAAVGHWRFLCFYLISGITGALLYSVMDLSSAIPLIGASGAISGVMAMYLGIFRLKKIQFFYWFFIFVGYIRAPALLILPFYIGKELFSFYTDTDSNVAFMAHTGGFIAGSMLLAVSFLINPKMLDQDYIETDQSIDPFQEKLDKVYVAIENYRFDNAFKALQPIITEHGLTFNLAILRYNLLKVIKPSDYDALLFELLKMKPPTANDLSRLATIWLENPVQQALFDDESAITLGMNFATTMHLSIAEEIFNRLHSHACRHPSLGFLARKISIVHQTLDHHDKNKQYEKFAETLSLGDF